MNSSNFLVRGRNFRYYFRIVVPAALRISIGQREFRRSLHTSDHRVALVNAWRMADEFHSFFARCRMQGFDPNDPLLKGLKIFRSTQPDGTITEQVEIDSSKVDEELDALEKYQKKNPLPQPITPAPAVSAPTAAVPTTPVYSPSKMLSEVIESYINEKKAVSAWTKNSYAENVSAYKRLVSFIGDRPIASLERKDAVKLLQILEGLPSPHGETLSLSVVNRQIGLMSSVFKYAIDQHIVTYNPFKGLQKKSTTRDDLERDIYDGDEMMRLFSPEHFVLDPRQPARYWIPLLMLFTGARPGELAQLTVDDIVKIDGVWCISINEHHQIKTKNAIRTVPLSMDVILRGFIRYVDDRRAKIEAKSSKDRRLFPELSITRAKPAGAVSSWWNVTHHKHCNIDNKKIVGEGRSRRVRRVSLYSLRHLVQTMFRDKGISETVAAEIVGHEKGGMTYGRYAKRKDLQPLISAIETLKYFDVTDQIRQWRV